MAAAKSLANEIYRLAHDPEPVVRSLAVAMLPDVPGPTAERILRAAINDPDERVQANAIEAMDRLNLPERVAVTAPKLGSTSSRVRANAVKSLLRTELRQSAETLLQMLDAESRAHRLSALWVIERMGLSAVLDRLYELGRDDPDERVRGRANRVIRTLHGQQVVGSWWHETAFPGDPDADAEGRP
jgi:HEAT repeat protein